MNKCICIDREYGSGGRETARILSEKLGIEWYDGERLLTEAKKRGLNPSMLADYDEKGVGSIIFDMARWATLQSGTSRFVQRPFEVFDSYRRLFCELAQEGPCIFLGRCADEALRGKAQVLSVFIYATDMAQRVRRAAAEDGVTEKNPEIYIKKRDEERRRFVAYFASKAWGQKENYDLCVNTSALGYDIAAGVIAAAWHKGD